MSLIEVELNIDDGGTEAKKDTDLTVVSEEREGSNDAMFVPTHKKLQPKNWEPAGE